MYFGLQWIVVFLGHQESRIRLCWEIFRIMLLREHGKILQQIFYSSWLCSHFVWIADCLFLHVVAGRSLDEFKNLLKLLIGRFSVELTVHLVISVEFSVELTVHLVISVEFSVFVRNNGASKQLALLEDADLYIIIVRLDTGLFKFKSRRGIVTCWICTVTCYALFLRISLS